ncbi:MAG: 4Fe-4S binding protein [Terracidiphilus sp.]
MKLNKQNPERTTVKRTRRTELGLFRKLLSPSVLLVIFWTVAITLWLRTGRIFFLFDIGFIGTSLGVGTGLYALLPRQKKPIGRRLAQFLIGTYIIGFLGLIVYQNMQLEGLLFFFCTGIFSGAIIHYSIAKLFGPLIFGRGFCGWACWTAMVLDLLPFDKSKGWVPGPWKWMRYAHFALSLSLVATLAFLFHYRPQGSVPLYWMLAGNLLYYFFGILLAYLLKDNRAFCKYLCPVPVLMKLGSRFALLKVTGAKEDCNRCMACVKACPMDIRIPDYVMAGQRVLSTECILCNTCVSACPTNTLAVSFGLDLGGCEQLQSRPSTTAMNSHVSGS